MDALANSLAVQIEAAQVPTARLLAPLAPWPYIPLALTSPWWPLACRLGWALIDLFGVRLDAPLVRLEDWGLAIAGIQGLAHTRLVELTGEGLDHRSRNSPGALSHKISGKRRFEWGI